MWKNVLARTKSLVLNTSGLDLLLYCFLYFRWATRMLSDANFCGDNRDNISCSLKSTRSACSIFSADNWAPSVGVWRSIPRSNNKVSFELSQGAYSYRPIPHLWEIDPTELWIWLCSFGEPTSVFGWNVPLYCYKQCGMWLCKPWCGKSWHTSCIRMDKIFRFTVW